MKRLLLVAVLIMGGGLPALAQTQSSRLQIGGAFSSLELDNAIGASGAHGGAGVRAVIRLTRRVAIDTRAVWFPGDADPRFLSQGGRSLQLAAGGRGKFVARPHYSIYGVLLPELIHFTKAFVGFDPQTGAGTIDSVTQFALDSGLGVEIYGRSRWTFWAESTGPLYLVDGVELSRSAPGPQGQVLIASLSPVVRNLWQVTVGANYHVGTMRDEPALEQPVTGRFEVGGHLAHRSAISFGSEHVSSQTALGGFASYRVCPGVYADGSLSIFTSAVPVSTPIDGGRLTQLLIGGKFGTRKDGFGFFAKFRVGLDSHSRVVVGSYADYQVRRADFLALDFGAVVERYIGPHLLLRFDGGDIYTAAGYLASEQHSLNLTVGAGWRF